MVITTTEGQLAQAFELWAARYKEDPSGFTRSVFDVPGQAYGEACAAYLLELLAPANGTGACIQTGGIDWRANTIQRALEGTPEREG